MFRTAVGLTALLAVTAICAHAARQEPSPASPHRALLDRYCVTCHNEKLKTAGLLLDKMDVDHPSAGAEVWEKVIRKLRTGAMPPPGMPRPDPARYDALATYLETSLDRAAAAKPNAGRRSVHRLNRAEYRNAVRDLLGVDLDIASLLPPDDSGYGFDNIADVLTVSPLLLERYMSAARKVTRLVLGDVSGQAVSQIYTVPKLLLQQDRAHEDLPFGTRGGMAVRHFFPVDGEYSIKIRLQRDIRTRILGLAGPHELDVLLDGEPIERFRIGGEFKGNLESLYSGAYQGEEYLYRADEKLVVQFPAKAGTHVLGVTFIKDRSRTFAGLNCFAGFSPESLRAPTNATKS